MIYRKVPIEMFLKNNDSINNRFYLYILNYFVNEIYFFIESFTAVLPTVET